MLGVYGAALLKHGSLKPAPFVAVTDVSPSRLESATRFGADAVVDVSGGKGDTAAAAELLAALPRRPDGSAPAGFDLVLEVCGSSAVVPLALRMLRPGGEIVFVGMVHPGTPLDGITGDAVIRKCATLRGVHNYRPRDLQAAVDFLAATVATLPYSELVSPPQRLDDLPAAVELARSGRFARVLLVP